MGIAPTPPHSLASLGKGLGFTASFSATKTHDHCLSLLMHRRALLLDDKAPNQFLTIPLILEWEGVVVMVIQSFLPKDCLVPLGIGRGGGHVHTQPSSQKLSSSSWNGKGWCVGLVQIVQEEEDNFLEEGCA